MKISDAVGAVDAVKAVIEGMHTDANVNAQNQLNALSALANAVATSSANQAAQIANQIAQIGQNNGGNTGTNNPPRVTPDVDTDGTNTAGISQEDYKRYSDLMNQYDSMMTKANKAKEDAEDKARRIAEAAVANSGIPASQGVARQSIFNAKYQEALNLKEYNRLLEEANKYKKQADALKNAAYAKGGTIGSAIKRTGEDGIILARTGEEVLSLERIKQMQSIFKMMQPLAALPANTLSNISSGTTINGMNVSFSLPNVTSYEDFVNKAKKDPQFEKLVQNITIGTALGKSKLSKYSI
jgi:hypothetical protein